MSKEIKNIVEESKYFMIETLAEKIAELILKKPKVKKVFVRVKKLSAIKDAKFVGAEIAKENK